MNNELNDETLTAYALGELDGAETKAVEKLLADAANSGNHAPRQSLEEIRAVVTLTQEAFAATAPEHELSGDQRDSVISLAQEKSKHRQTRIYAWRLLAAMFLLFVGAAIVLPMLARSKETGKPVSQFKIAAGEKAGASSSTLPSPSDQKKDEQPSTAPSAPRKAEEAKTEPKPMPAIADTGRMLVAEKSKAMSPAAPAAPALQSNLQAVQPGSSLRIRGKWYSATDAQRVAGGRTAGAPSTAEIEQLKSVGYGDAVEQRTRIRNQPAVELRFQTARAEIRNNEYFLRQSPAESTGAEAYKRIVDSGFVRVADQPLSTFSIDVDTASYSNMRRFLEQGQLPPPDAVRVEELINYFDYAYPAPTDGTPFAAHFEAAVCPWTPAHTLVRIGLKGREIPRAQRPATNLVFLIDVSGSMQPENKLPLVKKGMAMLTRQLDERDRVSIVTYASGVNLALPATNASHQDEILRTIENLGAGGSTNGAGGIQLAYQSARENFLPGGVNRIILATDGDFNVGLSDNDSLLSLIQQEAKSGVFLSVFGFGMGNLKDDKLELLADKGNGVYGYIDSESEARKVFVEKLSGTLVTIAKDVKIQVEFNPARVAAYRLVGYENRALAAQDFNDDRKDAGEIGASHTVTALYEVVPAGVAVPAMSAEESLRYQTPATALQAETAARPVAHAGAPAHTDELLLVKLRYKEPTGDASKLIEFPLKNEVAPAPSADLKFASAVAAFGKLLRGNPLGASLNYDGMMQLAQAGLAASDDPRRAEMLHLMLTARPLIEGIRTTQGIER